MNKYIKISDRKIGGNYPVFIIAEAGVNHNGDIKLAVQLIDAAKDAGADAVKFQTYKTEEIVVRTAPKADYQKRNSPNESQFAMLKKLELSEQAFVELKKYCHKKKVVFLSTPADPQSAEFLFKLGIPAYKIGSGDLTNIPLLVQIAKHKKPIILSTGMATLNEAREAIRAIYKAGNKKLTLLHCTSNYPTDYKDVNLRAMNTLKKVFKLPVGYSDHTEGIEVAIAAVAMGACVVEKHFTMSKKLPGPDHRASLEPDELRTMVRSIREVEAALGDGKKVPTRGEEEIKAVARKSVVACVDIPKGAIVSARMLACKRPGHGLPPRYLDRIIGQRTRVPIRKESLVRWEMFVPGRRNA